MKKTVFVGLFLVCISLVLPFSVATSVAIYTIQIDVIPTFLGFVLITMGLDNLPYRQKLLTNVKGLATALGVCSFITLFAQLRPFFAGLFTKASVGSGMAIFGAILAGISSFYTIFQSVFTAIYMFFIVCFCRAMKDEMRRRSLRADDSFRGWKKDAYGDPVYSKSMLLRYEKLSAVFSVVYTLVVILYVINQILALVNWANTGVAVGLAVRFFEYEFGLWAFLLPVHILFLLYANQAVNIGHQNRKDPTLSDGE